MKTDKDYYTFGCLEETASYNRTKRIIDFKISEEMGIECQLADAYAINS